MPKGQFKQISLKSFVLNDESLTSNVVRKEGSQFCIFSKAGKKLSCHKTKKAANKRLRQIEFFKTQNESFVTFNIKLLPKIRHDTFEGRPFLVVPMVMLVEGVHNGSQGPLLYLNEELRKAPQAWNHKPIVIYHPEGPTACDPAVLESRGVGLIFNTRFKDKLTAEAWLEKSKLKEVDERVLTSLENGETVEISTGLFMECDVSPGEWKGEEFIGTVRNMRPDHLAILPDQKGACSVADGAGLLCNQVSHEQLRDMLRGALNARFPNEDFIFIEAVFDNFVIYERDNKIWRLTFTSSDTEVTLTGEPEEVVRVTRFETPSGDVVGNLKGESPVDKKEFVSGLIANGAWNEDDRKFLMSLSEVQLTKIGSDTDVTANEKETEEPKKVTKVKKIVKRQPVANEDEDDSTADKDGKIVPFPGKQQEEPKEQTFEEWVGNAPAAYQEVIANSLQVHGAQKSQLIQAIISNEDSGWTEEELQAMNLKTLHKIAVPYLKAPKTEADPVAAFNFAGLGDVYRKPAKVTEEVLELPAMTFDKTA